MKCHWKKHNHLVRLWLSTLYFGMECYFSTIFNAAIILNYDSVFFILAMKTAKWEMQILTHKKEAFTKRSSE